MANLIREWIYKAEYDWDNAQLLSTREGYQGHALICYQCHQACEKYLKAVLQYLKTNPSKTHELPALAKLIPDLPQELVEDANIINPLGSAMRYPGKPTSDELAADALIRTARIRRWVYTYLKETPPDLFAPPDFL